MSTVTEAAAPLLAMRGIDKSFPGVRALEAVDLTVHAGEVVALVGENGAGKSTLIKILAGAQPMDGGEILVGGQPARIAAPADAMELGIRVIYQEFNLVPQLTVMENIYLGREPTRAGMVDFHAMEEGCSGLLERIGADARPRDVVGRLSVAQQQLVEIAKALSQDARILVLDEPSATLTDRELDRLFALIRDLRQQGVGMVYISHRLEEIFEIADTVTVLRDGHHVITAPTSELSRDDIIRHMVGRELQDHIPSTVAHAADEALRVEGLTRSGAFESVSLTVREGEIVALAGLVGSGRTEVARAIFGADPVDSGRILVGGEEAQIASPRDAISRGIGLATEDRKGQGLVLGMGVAANITLADLRAITRGGFLSRGAEVGAADRYVDQLQIRTPSLTQLVRLLSGGNQQKVVLAKWLFTDCRVLILDEPTRGIDVGAKTEIYHLMNELCDRGKAILMISSELPEVLGVAHRIYVMREGHMEGELDREDATQERIMHLATGGAAE
ncbi:MAG: ATP-binding cassette domain-containing protein [Armatimonadia bacterium]|nr:ATP-binding cassette domain-containing protein [Armatimonadia bacterium]